MNPLKNPSIIGLLCVYFVIPIFLAKVPLHANWKTIGIAYAIWLGILLVLGLSWGRTLDQALGWPLILGLFFTIPAIPLIVFILKKTRGM